MLKINENDLDRITDGTSMEEYEPPSNTTFLNSTQSAAAMQFTEE